MSIVTKTGDDGTTGLLFGRRVPKNHPRIEACGGVDELTSALGMARVAAPESVRERLLHIQRDLIVLMGEVATLPEDRDRLSGGGFQTMDEARIRPLEEWVKELESQDLYGRGWAIPGNEAASAALDFARAVARRAERGVCTALDGDPNANPHIVVYLNRVSDLLWLMARWCESGKKS